MEGKLQPESWEWIKAVLISSAVILAISSAALYSIGRFFQKRIKLERLSTRTRWILVFPMALVAGLIGEMIPRILFSAVEVVLNHHLLFRPGFDSLVWQGYAPLIFVLCGVMVAPTPHFRAFIILAGFRICVAIYNLVGVFQYTFRGGSWTALASEADSPLWQNAIVYFVLICILVGVGVYWVKKEGRWPFKPPPPPLVDYEKLMKSAKECFDYSLKDFKNKEEGEGEGSIAVPKQTPPS